MNNNGAATRFCNDDVGPSAFEQVAIIGGGAWGTALALTAYRAGRRVVLWAREESVVAAVARTGRNPFLPSVDLPAAVTTTCDLKEALCGRDLAVLVVPSQHLRGMARRVERHLPAGVPVVICSKGVEAETGMLMSEVVAGEMQARPFAVLSGPTFASEVAEGRPTAATIAAPLDGRAMFGPDQLASRVAVTFTTPAFRPYLTDDVTGVEVGGATKNVLAIACGIAAGRGMGANARAALITRGLAEIIRLGKALGARPETLCGLAGAGDLLLTCSDEKSRNYSFGKALGEGKRPVVDDEGPVVEGVANARSVTRIAAAAGVDMPICAAVERVLRGHPVDDAIRSLLASDLRAEPSAHDASPRIPNPMLGRFAEAASI